MSTVVILVLALVAPAFTLPFTTQSGTTTEIQGGSITNTGIDTVPQSIITEKIGGPTGSFTGGQVTTVEIGNPTYTYGEKTGIRGTTQEYTGQQTTGQVGTSVEGSVPSQTYTGFNEKTGVETVQTQGAGTTFGTQTQGISGELKAEGHPISPEQLAYTESPVVVPVQQPLSVVPSGVNPVGQLSNPIVVPGEVVSVGRIVIMSVEPIGQRVLLQNIVPSVEQQVPYQPTNQQPVAEYVPVQTQIVEPNPQVYNVQPVQSVVSAQPVNVEKQVPVGQQAQPTTTGYTSVQPVTVQKQSGEQVPSIVGYTPTQTQTVETTPQELTRTVLGNNPVQPAVQTVETSQQSFIQPVSPVQTYGYTQVPEQIYQQGQQQSVNYQGQNYQNVERQGSHQQVPVEQYPVQNQAVVLNNPQQQQQQQQFYNSQQVVPENVEKQGTHQQGTYQQGTYQQGTHQGTQQYVTDNTQTQILRTGEPNQQVPVPQVQVTQQQGTEYTQGQVYKTQEVTPQQQVGQQVQPQVETQQQGTGYTETQGYKTQGVTPQQSQVGTEVHPQNTGYTQDSTYKTQNVASNQQQFYNVQPQAVNQGANVAGFGVPQTQQSAVDPASVQNFSVVPQQPVEPQQTVVVPQQQVVSQ